MKIGIFDPYLDTLGGGEKYMLVLAQVLSEKHDVCIFWDKKKEDEIKAGAMQRFGLNLNTINFLDNIFSIKTPFLKRLWELQKYDVIVYLSDGSIPFSLKKNLIIHFQFPVERVKPSLLGRVKFLSVKQVICNSKFTKSYIDKKFYIDSKILYPPVDIMKNTTYKKENIILHVGRFSLDTKGNNFKKQDFMIDVFKKIATKITDWRFILIISVKKEDKEKIKSLRERAKGFPIEIIENPSNEKLWQMYQKAKIYWHASGFGENLEKNPEKAEHFGIATAEAMGAGAVPVVINAGGQPEIVMNGKNGFLWDTEEEFITRTKQIISNNTLWQEFSKEGQQAVIKFNKERFCEEIKGIVE
ncbi:MAG: glycosyltransferase family 4 protein [Candidatus Levyibacteriota bacterium]|nr:MAG: glycosyltransferase family 4 protein [Candidatus Levybacteria bacterium]